MVACLICMISKNHESWLKIWGMKLLSIIKHIIDFYISIKSINLIVHLRRMFVHAQCVSIFGFGEITLMQIYQKTWILSSLDETRFELRWFGVSKLGAHISLWYTILQTRGHLAKSILDHMFVQKSVLARLWLTKYST